MQQVITDHNDHASDGAQQFKYGGSATSISLAILFGMMMLYVYEPMTSGKVEWHLFLRSLPVVPHEIMVGLWWVGITIAAFGLIVSFMPAVKVILDNDKITAQSIYTRNLQSIRYGDISDIVYNKNYISITDRNNNKIKLARLFLSSSAFRTIGDKLRSSARNAH